MSVISNHKPGSFCWFELGTTDQEAAKKFYGSLFGWSADDLPMGPDGNYTMFKLDGQVAAAGYTVGGQMAPNVPPHWALYIAVQSADDAAKQVEQNQGKLLKPPFDVFDAGRMAVAADPSGAVFMIWQPKRNQGTGITGVDGTVCWADLSTPDPARAAEFYKTLFGWELTKGENDSSGYLHIKNDDEFIGGIPPAEYYDATVPPHWLIYFQVSNCDESVAKATGMSAQVLFPPTDVQNVGRMAIIKDPQGAVFALFQPAAR
jgi:predicted enzyme related to lactoylglutathione lyase